MSQEQIVGAMGVVFEVAIWLVVLAIAIEPSKVLRVVLGKKAISASSPGTLQIIRLLAVLIVVVLLPSIYTQIMKIIRG